jgi:signal transduction histidine kinase
MMRTRLPRSLMPSTPRGAVLAIGAAAFFLVLETVLVILLKQVDPSDPVSVLWAWLMVAALLANFVVGLVAARKAVLALNASRARIVAAGYAARRQVERDLHDGVQQRLVASTLRVRLAEQLVPDELDDLKQQLAEVASELTDVSAELRELSRGLHPAILSQGGLSSALKMLARRSTVPVTLDAAIDRRLPDSVEVAGYYFVAEALTNAAKHAHAAEITVCARTGNGRLRISVHDDGIGGAELSEGSGLIGLKDRVEAMGGTVRLVSPRGGGTSLDVDIPLNVGESPSYQPIIQWRSRRRPAG